MTGDPSRQSDLARTVRVGSWVGSARVWWSPHGRTSGRSSSGWSNDSARGGGAKGDLKGARATDTILRSQPLASNHRHNRQLHTGCLTKSSILVSLAASVAHSELGHCPARAAVPHRTQLAKNRPHVTNDNNAYMSYPTNKQKSVPLVNTCTHTHKNLLPPHTQNDSWTKPTFSGSDSRLAVASLD